MIHTNVKELGGDFDERLLNVFEGASSVSIASGYVSLDVIERYAPRFLAIAKAGGTARLLVGMAWYEGLSQKKLTRLQSLSLELRKHNSRSGIFVPFIRKYHGKIYHLESQEKTRLFVGSSNFSASGLMGNMEATVPITDSLTIQSTLEYLDFLFSSEVSKTIDELEIIVPGSRKYKQNISAQTLDELIRFNPKDINLQGLSYFDLDLTRYADKMKSSLNVYFGKGRENTTTGKVTPRNWFETAIIAKVDIINNPLYPKGTFEAYTDDGYVIPMSTSGDNFKNIQSKGNLLLFGMWFKTRLQRSGALVPLTPITLDTLEAYGRTSLRIYKISDTKYFIDFSAEDDDNDIKVEYSE